MRAREFVKEVNAPDELTVPEDLVQRFTTAGWQIEGEGRDQIVLGKPNSKYVLKIVGQGSGSRIDQIRRYIDFYRRNQRNPHWPRVGGDRTLKWGNKTYYAYTQEKLQHLPGDEAVLDYLEYAMGEISHGEEPDFSKIPPGLSEDKIVGLMYAVDDLFSADIGGQYQFDLSNVYNIMQRPNGQLVIVDPFAGWDDDEALDESAVTEGKMAELYMDLEDSEISDKQFEKMYGMTRKEAREQFSQTDMWAFPELRDPNKPLHEQGVAEGVPQPGPSSGAPKQFGPDAEIQTRQMTAKDIIKSVPGVPYYNNVIDDWDAKDYSWGVTKKVIEYATYLRQHPESLSKLPPAIVLNGKFEDGAHRVSALWLLQQRMDPKNPLWANAKLNVQFVKQGVTENFADGKVKGRSRPGRVKRAGASCAGSVTDLRARAKKYGGEKGKMYHWCANMKSGRKK